LVMFTRAVPFALLLIAALLGTSPAFAQTSQTAPAQTVWRLLDYLAVDYAGAVQDGKVISEAEYKEMIEFSRSARERITLLPVTPAKMALQQQAVALEKLIADKASPEQVAAAARAVAGNLIKAYPVPLAPTSTPDPARGKALFAQHCASCHGATGDAKGPDAADLDPPPIAFIDESRARERSVFALYQVIEQGLDDTSMRSFAELPADDRWALAFYAGSFAYPEGRVAAGEKIWKSDAALRSDMTLEKLVGTTPAVMAASMGEDKAKDVVAYLRHHPEAIAAQKVDGSLTVARAKLNEALAAYTRQDRKAATDLALSAYLDGFEPVEPVLSARDSTLMVRIETAMAALRTGISNGEPVETVRGQVQALDDLFAQAEIALGSSQASGMSSFVAAFTILVREGLEAILIVIAMITFLIKAERRDVLPYVHGGWIAALAGGAATWVAATWMINISGASRELTEGFGSLFAALVLLWVGIWMHGKSNAESWQRYIREKLTHALNRRSAWFLFLLAFVVVYREVFETILFYAAIWSQGNGASVLAGAGAAVAVLAVVAIVMMRYSRQLPIGKFFAYSALLIAVLAVVLIGKGVSALQEAGYLPIALLSSFPRIEILGVYPTREGVIAQILMAILLFIGFRANTVKAAK
jgi:high-affinity iron transporter